ncbi:AMP-dependent synthetase/ligase [Phaeacidiphilus oryzae]|uniref:AMP-dependent synthetase/ligase n=1 Tax=Phaeacidiphilus oryzae TaxID=348818 RepID=UPI000560F519|nr:AMP-dependent synthetase/ligase [Phaeacidiphilus oryzae]
MREYSVPPLADPLRTGGLADSVFEVAQTSPDFVQLSRRVGEGDDAVWQDVTAREFRDQVVAVAKGLLYQGIGFGDRVAIMSRTRYEWTLFDYALWTIGAQGIPVYPTSSSEQVRWILADSGVVACLVEHEDHAMTVGAVVEAVNLRQIWQLDAGAIEQLMADGRAVPDSVIEQYRRAVTPDHVATIIYTSGTTGRPKGCVITHGNFAAECDNIVARYHMVFSKKASEPPATLLFLPLAHVFGRMIEIACFRGGVKLGHEPSLSATTLIPSIASFRPTFILAVPHIFEKLLTKARQAAEESGKAGAFDRATATAQKYSEALERQAFGEGSGPGAALRLQHQLWDKLVYNKMRTVLGGKVRYAMSGGSSMSRDLGLFFRGAGITVIEGYGLTETSAAACANPPDKMRCGTVGIPIPGTEIRIADDGEIWVRGGQVFAGYLNQPEATSRTLHGGWLATGDLGTLDEHGYLEITGRKKEIIVTSGGKSVSPSVLEERVRAHPLISHCLVVGDDRPFIGALVTLDQEALAHWQRTRGKPMLGPLEARNDPDLQAEIQRVVVTANTAVSRAESIRAFRILPTEFTEDQGLLTPSLKLRRAAILRLYAADIEALYTQPALS